jgi:hypothetical protein
MSTDGGRGAPHDHRVVDLNLNRWLYAGGRPNLIARAVNRGWAALWATGVWPRRMNTLELRGRQTGNRILLPVVIADYDGERYLVSMLGARSSWVANAKAAGGSAVLHHGKTEQIQLEPVPTAERAPILKRYLEVAPGARPHFPIDQSAPLSEFRRIAARYPVFRIRALAGAPRAARSGGAGRTYSRLGP